jgi:hypothetical protein
MSWRWGRSAVRVWVARVAAMSVVLVSLAGLFTAHPAHADTTTVINFDGLAAGTVVADQYASDGVEFGFASGFGQTAPGGVDCGSPSVGSGATPASAPN